MAEESLELEIKPQAKSKKNIIIAAVVGLLVLIGGAIAAYFLLSGDSNDSSPAQTETAMAEPEGPRNSMYVSLPAPFLFNLPINGNEHVVQIKVQLQVRNDEHQVVVRKHLPFLRDALLTTFSSANGITINSSEGKEELRTRALLNVQTAMTAITGSPYIERVLFTGFVMQ
ncbi:flagellar basal body-associated protein FliL [Ferrimonas lipolytica]|uniref:Flagellar protein FliL n=1 Tax=Ferrimonas lipolytica TaxID=2724191 RepID=A0A6H1UHT4_9GAMM|nr:flagellar basal body-associated protein FliL [Ferrimonas lipolytica]QIZ77352.1 flagellar basal body-associated protein FliL [Ferrimonas lipolytica]